MKNDHEGKAEIQTFKGTLRNLDSYIFCAENNDFFDKIEGKKENMHFVSIDKKLRLFMETKRRYMEPKMEYCFISVLIQTRPGLN